MNINLQKNNRENKNFVYMRIIYAVDMHRKAMRYVYNIMDMRYEAWYVSFASRTYSLKNIKDNAFLK